MFAVIDAVLEVVRNFEANHPELLKAAYVINGRCQVDLVICLHDVMTLKISKFYCSNEGIYILIRCNEALPISTDVWENRNFQQ